MPTFDPSTNRVDKGRYGETIAAGYLRARGHQILQTRYKCPYGEIDLITRQGDTIVFAEVKLRKSQKSGPGAESVTPAKQRRLINAARHYISTQNPGLETYRFDVLDIFGREFYTVNHIEDAFYAES